MPELRRAESSRPPATAPLSAVPDGSAVAASDSAPFPHLPASVRRQLAELETARAAANPAQESATAKREAHGRSELTGAFLASRRAIGATFLFSMVINVLMLAGPLFMLQVYDRVMSSGSLPTLIALSIITATVYVFIGILELVRSRVLSRIAGDIDARISDRVLEASLRAGLAQGGGSATALRELDHLRQFVAGPAPMTIFDAPWTPVYIAVIAMLHWTLGMAAAAGAVVLLAIALWSEFSSRRPLAEATRAMGRSLELAEVGHRNVEVIASMGMLEAFRRRWQRLNGEALAWQTVAADRLGTSGAVTKSLRLLMQSGMLALGAVLALQSEISAGAIVAATIIFGRALAPVEMAVGNWRGTVRARAAYRKLAALLHAMPELPARTALPTPSGRVSVEALRVAAPQTRQLILSNVNFKLEPGQVLGVIGPSASGKSTLARVIVGLWPALSGAVRLDGAKLDQWGSDALGLHIGYLPQGVELFAGSVRENIARFREDASDEDVVAAARMAHAHELVLALPDGYDTELGAFASHLSAGQRQRIALARALFGRPPLVVLDEPNSNLDRAGDEALTAAIDDMRRRGQTVVIVSHRMQALASCDLVLFLDRGVQRIFGPRHDVLRQLGGGEAAGKPVSGVPDGSGAKP
ncbi:MAG: type I secretion system permease/ATPase [Hyphomicrobiaceae bacterium]